MYVIEKQNTIESITKAFVLSLDGKLVKEQKKKKKKINLAISIWFAKIVLGIHYLYTIVHLFKHTLRLCSSNNLSARVFNQECLSKNI